MARKPTLNEKSLTKMEIRKLNALKKSIGDELGTKAFLEWLRKKPQRTVGQMPDKTAAAIAAAVEQRIKDGKIGSLRRGGYVVKRGRGRVIVSPVE